MKLKTIYSLILASVMAFSASANEKSKLKVYDVNVTVDEHTSSANVLIDLHMADFNIGRDSEIVYTPILFNANGTDSIELDPITICGRNRHFYYMRQGALDSGEARIYRAGSKEKASLTYNVPLGTMTKCTIEMREEAATCCNDYHLVPGTSANGHTELAVIDTELPAIAPELVFAPPVDDKPVEKNIEGKAFVSFVVNRTELKPDYMVNRREIAKILNSIDYVRQDSDATITGVHIKGFASPEGSYQNNVRLAHGRTVTLSEYVAKLYKFDKGIVTNSFEPEDWDGLRRYLIDSLDYQIEHRDEILTIANSTMEPDAKDHYIRATYPADYKVILKEIYPWLRHSDYTVSYRIKVYTDIDELKRVYAADPTRLRPVDFYTLARLHDEGSEEYLNIMKTAVEVYPDDPMLNLNAANIDFINGNLNAAQSHLLKSGNSAEANYARGVLASRRADWSEAERYFTIAQQAGISQANNALDMLATIRAHKNVTITAKTTKND